MLDLKTMEQQALADIAKAKDLQELDGIRVDYLGKKGKITEHMKNLATMPAADRPAAGQVINQVRVKIVDALELKQQHFKDAMLALQLEQERIDVTLSGRASESGSLHPVTLVRDKINTYFTRMGFDLVEGPEIETEYYNFEALNIPETHPARAMHDTFYFGDGRLLRTHTSPVQIRHMEQQQLPLRLIAPGRVYRCDSDMTHTPMFHQVEGLMIDKSVTMAELRGLLTDFFSWFFGQELALRFRPSYFPFTEPSAEVDIQCTQCHGKGCRSCQFTGWLEVLGCGMVHPKVLEHVGIDSNEYQGWAFGMGMDRLAMLYFGIHDLRLMFENDVTFLRQF